MIVEHTFITTLEAPAALTAASEFLQQAGFIAEAQTAFALDGVWRSVRLQRGSAGRPSTSTPLRAWPQRVRVDWDRGRVEMAASITAPTVRKRFGAADVIPADKDRDSREYLINLANALELLLARNDQAHARELWAAYDERLARSAETRNKGNRGKTIGLAILGVLVIAAVILTILS